MNAWELNRALMSHCPYPADQAIPVVMAVFNETKNSYDFKAIYHCESDEYLVDKKLVTVFIDKKCSGRRKKVLTVGDIREKLVGTKDSKRTLFLQDFEYGPNNLWEVAGFGITLTEDGSLKNVFITDYCPKGGDGGPDDGEEVPVAVGD